MPRPSQRLMLMLLALASCLSEVKKPATVSITPYRTNRPPMSRRMSNSLAAADLGVVSVVWSVMSCSFLDEDQREDDDVAAGDRTEHLRRGPPLRLGHR